MNLLGLGVCFTWGKNGLPAVVSSQEVTGSSTSMPTCQQVSVNFYEQVNLPGADEVHSGRPHTALHAESCEDG